MFILLLVICALVCSLSAYPLCFFARNFQAAYTFTVSALILALLAFLVFRQIKKQGAKSAVFFSVKFLIISAGIAAFFTSIFSGRRVLALIFLASTVAAFVLSSHFLKSNRQELASESA
ncbi:hypothetical protein [Treponema sp. UBA3813]|uniref:hypothetical protein n=1 Tax=Treponema sp. UBA3813 TaxID=1947715 RepID=UPI0025F99627|nr:hypothetical protein [Treponema sp. UBA3813]